MEEQKVEAETLLAEMESALYDARPDAKERAQPRRVAAAVRAAHEELDRLGLAHDHDLFEMVDRNWEKGYPVDEEYEADVRDLKAQFVQIIEQLRPR